MCALPVTAPAEAAQGLALRPILKKTVSFPAFLGALLVAGTFFTVCLNLQKVPSLPAGYAHTSIIEGDTWWHINVGERILSTHAWPTSDSYSFTVRGNEWIAYEWLGEVVMALAARIGGLPALTGLLVTLAAAILLLLYYYAHLRSGNAKAAFTACVAVLPLAAVCFSLRPQLLGYIFLLVTLICLERFRRGRAASLWFLPVVFLLWVNTHGTFSLGLLVLGTYWASGLVDFRVGGLEAAPWTAKQRRQLALVCLLSVLTLVLNPYGTRLVGYELQVAFSQPLNIANIQEWQSLPFNLSWGKLFLVFLLLLLLAQAVFRSTHRLEEIGLLMVAVYEACVHLRFVLFFVLVFAPVLATLLSRWMPVYEAAKDRYVLNAALIVLIAAALVRFFPSNHELERVIARGFPRGAVEYLQQHPVAGPMFNEDLWGGYLTRSLGPEHRVFIDGRADAYEPAGVLADYLRITRLDRDTQSLLRAYGVEACLIERDIPLATLLEMQPDWHKVYTDDLSSLFVLKQGLITSGRDAHRTPAGEGGDSEGGTDSALLAPRAAPLPVALARSSH